MIIFKTTYHTKSNITNITLITCLPMLFLASACMIKDYTSSLCTFPVAVAGTRDGKWRAVRRKGLSPIIGRPIVRLDWAFLSINCRIFSVRNSPNWIVFYAFNVDKSSRCKKNFLYHLIVFRMHSTKLICISVLSTKPMFPL